MTANKEKLFDKTCSICMMDFEPGEDMTITPCKHSYHHDCINSWIDLKIKNVIDSA